jgi:hypothetical protein
MVIVENLQLVPRSGKCVYIRPLLMHLHGTVLNKIVTDVLHV